MTAQEIIDIIVNEEHKLYERCNALAEIFGPDSREVQDAVCEWYSLTRLCSILEIR